MNFDQLPSLPIRLSIVFCLVAFGFSNALLAEDGNDDQTLVNAVEQHRIQAINSVIGSVIAIYDEDRQGGGSGVIIDPSGIALTNHHVIMGAGITGWGGLADGEMYRWNLIGTDPGGDVSIIQMEGKQAFPFTPLGDSDQVRVGDWALAMGNPFILTEDQSPTVTLGIVSGVKRYQPGAGMNQLVYGNCIQVDSSINPGNSGGPLFNLNAEVIGINGRGSFKERGRVNVGLGYAISANQIKNFIPELLATKLVEHATLDASFSDREGKVVCSQISLDAPIAAAGLKLGDELLEFEGTRIKNANQFTNLICTLPEDWPAELKIRKPDESELTILIRCFGLPYQKPKVNPQAGGGREKNPEQEKQLKRQREMVKLLSAPPGEVRFKDINRKYAEQVIAGWKKTTGPSDANESLAGAAKLVDRIFDGENQIGSQTIWLAGDGRIRVETEIDNPKQGNRESEAFVFDGKQYYAVKDGKTKSLTLVEAKLNLTLVQAIAMSSAFRACPFEAFGEALIDGADKAQGKNAYRFKLLDDDQDHFFCWLQMYGNDGGPAKRLLKASAHKDCEETGGVTFSKWKRIGPVELPLRREIVSGLAESNQLTISSDSATWLDEVDEAWFVVNAVGQPDAEAPVEQDSADEADTADEADKGKADSNDNRELR